jgi:hypothetical protein
MQPHDPHPKALNVAPLVVAAGVSAAVFFMAQLDIIRPFYAQWDKVAHALCFFGVWWVFRVVLPASSVGAFVLAAALGGSIEIYQISHPQFQPSWFDFSADLVGAGVAWATSLAFPSTKDVP